MNRAVWEEERAKLQSILGDIETGMIKLSKGQEEYLASLSRRIAHLNDKIARDNHPTA